MCQSHIFNLVLAIAVLKKAVSVLAQVYLFSLAMMASAVLAYPLPQPPQGLPALPKPGPNGHYAPDHYFQYTNVPAPKVFECGYRRGNDPLHFREEYLSQKDHTFKAKVGKIPSTGCSEILVTFGNGRILKLYNFRQSLIAQFIQNSWQFNNHN